MSVKLNVTQQELLNLAKEKGFLTIEDFETQYTSPISVNRNMKRFILLKLLKVSEKAGRFDYIGGKK